MALTVLTLAIPAGDGVGAASNAQALDSEKSFVIDGTVGNGEIVTIEATEDTAGLVGWGGVISTQSNNPGPIVISHVAAFYRVRRIFARPANAPTASVAATSAGVNTFFTLTVAAIGAGIAVDVSAGGQVVSFSIAGVFGPGEQIVIQGSNDGVSSWNGIVAYNSAPGLNFLNTTYKFLRTFRNLPSGAAFSVFAGTSSSGGGGGGFPGFGVGVAGPTALGNAGVAATARRSDQTAAAYRSDLPLSTTWFIDPVNGSDAAANGGTTSATALKTYAELKRRWWGAELTSNTTVTVLGSAPAGDTNVWNTAAAPGVLVAFIGSLGATTGFGGAAINNTLISGTVTAFVASGDAPAVEDIELTDAGMAPASWTAAGALASGIIFKRTNGGALFWYGVKDLGAKTLRITPPMNNAGVNMSAAVLAVNDAYTAFTMWTYPIQEFPYQFVRHFRFEAMLDVGVAGSLSGFIPETGYDRRRVWLGPTMATRTIVNAFTNCFLEITGGATTILECWATFFASWIGGGGRSNGAGILTIFGPVEYSAAIVWQGIQTDIDQGSVQQTATVQYHDCTIPTIQVRARGEYTVNISVAGAGISGKGNTGKLVWVNGGTGGRASFYYGSNGAAPPWLAGETTDATPIQIGGVSYAVADLPTVSNTALTAQEQFPNPSAFTTPANAAVAVLINNAPAGSPASPTRYIKIPDGAGGFFTFPSLT